MAKSLALQSIPTLNPDEEEPSAFDRGVLRVINNNFRSIALALNGGLDTATQLEAALENNTFGAFTGLFADFGPSLSQNVALTSTVTHGRYMTIGELVIFNWHVTITSAGVANNAILITVPALMQQATNNPVAGVAYYYDASAGATYSGPLLAASNFQVYIFNHNSGAPVGVNPNFAAANTDTHSGFVIYESV